MFEFNSIQLNLFYTTMFKTSDCGCWQRKWNKICLQNEELSTFSEVFELIEL